MHDGSTWVVVKRTHEPGVYRGMDYGKQKDLRVRSPGWECWELRLQWYRGLCRWKARRVRGHWREVRE